MMPKAMLQDEDNTITILKGGLSTRTMILKSQGALLLILFCGEVSHINFGQEGKVDTASVRATPAASASRLTFIMTQIDTELFNDQVESLQAI
jgi:hypothetical protein